MSDDNGSDKDCKERQLEKEQQKKAIEWLNGKWKNKTCEICGETNWTLPEKIVSPTILEGKNIQLGGVSYPQFMAICRGCGNTKYFNALLSGVLEKEENSEVKNAKGTV